MNFPGAWMMLASAMPSTWATFSSQCLFDFSAPERSKTNQSHSMSKQASSPKKSLSKKSSIPRSDRDSDLDPRKSAQLTLATSNPTVPRIHCRLQAQWG